MRKLINTITRTESHYLRVQTGWEYIDNNKNLAGQSRDYKEHREKQQLQYVMFHRIFNGEYNISYIPEKDQCDLCAFYINADDEA